MLLFSMLKAGERMHIVIDGTQKYDVSWDDVAGTRCLVAYRPGAREASGVLPMNEAELKNWSLDCGIKLRDASKRAKIAPRRKKGVRCVANS